MITKDITKAELHLLAYRAHETLRARLKSVAREHADRMKQLDHIMVQIAASDPSSNEFPGVGTLSLTPEVERLLVNPTHGL